MATYNVHPPKAGLYFNKIQCFCFDEQRLKPREEIDMPVRACSCLWMWRGSSFPSPYWCLIEVVMGRGPVVVVSNSPTDADRHFGHQVFFFIDPEILNDPSMDNVHEITLSYTFFKTDEDNQAEIQRILEQNRGDGPGSHNKPLGNLATAPA